MLFHPLGGWPLLYLYNPSYIFRVPQSSLLWKKLDISDRKSDSISKMSCVKGFIGFWVQDFSICEAGKLSGTVVCNGKNMVASEKNEYTKMTMETHVGPLWKDRNLCRPLLGLYVFFVRVHALDLTTSLLHFNLVASYWR